MNYILGTFEGTVKWGFTITFPILIFAYLVKKTFRPFIQQWRLACYKIAFVWCLDIFVSRLSNLIETLKLVPKNIDGYNFYYSRANDPEIYLYVVLVFVAALLFIFERIRASLGWGLLVLILLHFETFYVKILYLYRDYLPSSFIVTYNPLFGMNPYLLSFIAFNLLVLILYFSKKFLLKNKSEAPSL
jgi:hypothetical protein